MAVTISTGIFSGLDVGKIVDQLMAVERRPLDQLAKKKSDLQAKISSYGSISSALSSLKNSLSALKKGSASLLSTTSSDTSVFTATASSSASEGVYNIKVNNIASSHYIYSQTFDSENAPVADLSVHNIQKLRIQVGSNDPVDITIDSTNNTLSGIKNAINNANAGVKASVINDGTGYRLVLNSNSTGSGSKIILKVDEDNNGIFEEAAETDSTGLSRLAFNATYDSNGNVTGGITNMTQSQAAVDASLVINGLTVTRSSNSISDLITGVTINLLKDSSGNTLKLTVAKDAAKILNSVNSFVSAYKSVIELAKKSSGESGLLNDDSVVRSIIDGLRSSVTATYSDKTLLRFGLSHDKYGVLSINSSTLENSIKQDTQGVIDTLDAMAFDLESKINSYINNMIPARKGGAETSIKLIESRMESTENILEKKETEYRKRFAALEKTIGELQRSGDYMTQQFSMLSKIYGGK